MASHLLPAAEQSCYDESGFSGEMEAACLAFQAGLPMERVSVFLGHSSIKVTEKHYSPRGERAREQSERDIRHT